MKVIKDHWLHSSSKYFFSINFFWKGRSDHLSGNVALKPGKSISKFTVCFYDCGKMQRASSRAVRNVQVAANAFCHGRCR